MGQFLRALEELLPGHLHDILEWGCIPWNHLKSSHSDLPGSSLTALFEAYLSLDKYLNLNAMASHDVPEESWGCLRCGFCYTSMRPGPISSATYQRWETSGAPVAWFYVPVGLKRRKPTFKCWYNCGVRLRICPFMLINRNDSRVFCSIYHMGDDFRPSVCSNYIPRHETCTAKRVIVEAWETS